MLHLRRRPIPLMQQHGGGGGGHRRMTVVTPTTAHQYRHATSSSSSVVIKSNGGPSVLDVVSKENTAAVKPGPQEVRLGLIKSQILRADLDMMLRRKEVVGKVGGIAGLFKVLDVGSGVKGLEVGDRVMPDVSNGYVQGAWRTDVVCPAQQVTKMPKDFSNIGDLSAHMFATTVLQNVKPGSVVAVNGAQFATGMAVTVVGVAKGLKVVCIVGSCPDNANYIKQLKRLGAEIVAPEGYEGRQPFTGSAMFRDVVADLPPAVLAINQVGGSIAHDIARMLGDNGTLLCAYGAPITLPVSLLMDKDITVKGFNGRRELAKMSHEKRTEMVLQVADSVSKLTPDQRAKTTVFELNQAVVAAEAAEFGPISILKGPEYVPDK